MIPRTEDNQTFFVACIAYFILMMQWGTATSMLPIYVHELGGSPFEVGLIFTLFAGISFFSHTLWGTYSDRIGRRKAFIVFGMIGLASIFLIMSYVKEPLPLILLRGSTAVFAGAIFTTTWALVSDISSPEIVGKSMGFVSFFGMAGFGVGPIIGGFIADSFGFSVLWLFITIICSIGGFAFFLIGRDPRGLKKNVKQTFFTKVLKNRKIRKKISALCATFSVFLLGYALVGPNYKIHFINLGFTKTLVGVASFFGTIVSASVQPFVGSGSDKYGRRVFFVIGPLGLALGNILLLLARDVPLVFIAWILIMLYDTFQLVGSAYVADFVSEDDKAGALGFVMAMGSITRSLAAAVGGLIISATSIPTLIAVSAVFPLLSIVLILTSL